MTTRREQQEADIAAALRKLVQPGQVVELRAPGIEGKKRTDSGYFDDLSKLAREAARLDNMTGVHGVYITLNPVTDSLLARAENRVQEWAKETAANANITVRRWLAIDADPVRPAGISATDVEHDAALALVARVRDWLTATGWPAGIMADSGNGGHLLYRVDLPNTPDSTDLVRRCLAALGALFDDPAVKIDPTVYNAARIWKLYGTTARKGDNTDKRPHRRAAILDAPDDPQIVPVSLLRTLADGAPMASQSGKNGNGATKTTTPANDRAQFWRAETSESVETWAAGHGLNLGTRRAFDGGGSKWTVDCLTSTEHSDGAALLLNGDGYLQYKCNHNSCAGRSIADVLRTYPPPATVRLNGGAKRAQPDDEDHSGDVDQADDAPAHRQHLPQIDPRNQLRTLRDEALAAIVAANERTLHRPVLLVRAGQLVRLKATEEGRTVIEVVTAGALLNILADVADWVVIGEDKKSGEATYSPAQPPQNVVTALLNAGEWPGLPLLDGIVYAPTFDRNGRLHSAPGYDPHTRLYNAGEVTLGDTTPTVANVRAAVDLVTGDLFYDFPFADNASRAHAVALYLLPFIRRMIDGPTVMHMATAPTAGTGKTLVVSVALAPALGDTPEPVTVSPDPSELDKLLTAKVIEGPGYLFLDNISGKLDSASLASALTQVRFNRRLLGTNTTVSGRADWVWAGTANNPVISEELTRRAVLIRLDAGVEKPDARTGFKHPDIARWAQEHRADLVTAAITLVRNWQENAAGRRWHVQAKGSFEQWAEIMGGILDAAGVPGFLANDDELREQAAPEVADLRAFVAAWGERFGQSSVTVKMLMPIASTVEDVADEEGRARAGIKSGDDLLGNLLGDGSQRSRETRLGFLLKEHKDRVFGDWRITEGQRDGRNNCRTWSLKRARPTPPPAERCGTLRNVDHTEAANVPQLSTSGDLAFREVLRNVAERFDQSNVRNEKIPTTQAHTPAHEEDTGKRSATFRNVSQNHRLPEVDSARNVWPETFRNVPQNGLQRSASHDLAGYAGRDLTAAELDVAVRLGNAAGATFRQLPAGGGLWRFIVDHVPEPDTAGGDLLAELGV